MKIKKIILLIFILLITLILDVCFIFLHVLIVKIPGRIDDFGISADEIKRKIEEKKRKNERINGLRLEIDSLKRKQKIIYEKEIENLRKTLDNEIKKISENLDNEIKKINEELVSQIIKKIQKFKKVDKNTPQEKLEEILRELLNKYKHKRENTKRKKQTIIEYKNRNFLYLFFYKIHNFFFKIVNRINELNEEIAELDISIIELNALINQIKQAKIDINNLEIGSEKLKQEHETRYNENLIEKKKIYKSNLEKEIQDFRNKLNNQKIEYQAEIDIFFQKQLNQLKIEDQEDIMDNDDDFFHNLFLKNNFDNYLFNKKNQCCDILNKKNRCWYLNNKIKHLLETNANFKLDYFKFIITEIISDFEKQENYLFFRQGLINMKIIDSDTWQVKLFKQVYGSVDNIGFTNVVFKKNNITIDEYVTNNGNLKQPFFHSVHICKRNILIDGVVNTIKDFCKNQDENGKWQKWSEKTIQKENFNIEEFQIKTCYFPGDFFLYDLNKIIKDEDKSKNNIDVVDYVLNNNLLEIGLYLKNADNLVKRYKKYLEYAGSQKNPEIYAEKTTFKNLYFKFLIDLQTFHMKEIYVLDDYDSIERRELPFSKEEHDIFVSIQNKIKMMFFYNKEVDININEPFDYNKYTEFNEKKFVKNFDAQIFSLLN